MVAEQVVILSCWQVVLDGALLRDQLECARHIMINSHSEKIASVYY